MWKRSTCVLSHPRARHAWLAQLARNPATFSISITLRWPPETAKEQKPKTKNANTQTHNDEKRKQSQNGNRNSKHGNNNDDNNESEILHKDRGSDGGAGGGSTTSTLDQPSAPASMAAQSESARYANALFRLAKPQNKRQLQRMQAAKTLTN